MLTGILFTGLTGLFFLIGIVLLKKNNNKEWTSRLTIALAMVVLLGLLLFDLGPELIEDKNPYLLIPLVIGFLILILLDKLVPHHHHEHSDSHCDKHDHENHLNHIGIITILALTVHNMIEGLSLYSVTLSSVKSGLLMMLGISLHNIPLGFQIGNSLEEKKTKPILIILLCLSSLLGALIFIMFGSIDNNILNILLAITFGMLLYILIFELFGEVKNYLHKKETIYGIIIGIIILVIANFL